MFNIRKKKEKQKPPVQVETLSSNPDNQEIPDYIINDSNTVGYVDRDTQRIIYEYVMKYTLPTESIIDYGAGVGDLFGFLKYKYGETEWNQQLYSGLEMNDILVQAAAVKYPGINIIKSNWFTKLYIPMADWSVNILSLTTPYDDSYNPGNKLEYLHNTVMNMLSKCKVGAMVTLLVKESPDYITYSVSDLVEFCDINNFSYIIDKSLNDNIVNLIILK